MSGNHNVIAQLVGLHQNSAVFSMNQIINLKLKSKSGNDIKQIYEARHMFVHAPKKTCHTFQKDFIFPSKGE